MEDSLGIKVDKRQSRQKRVDNIRKEAIKREESTRNEVRAENQIKAKETLGITDEDYSQKRPAPETVAIKASKLVIAKFTNRENPATPEEGAGAEIELDKGAFHFKLYDGHSYCMPEIMVTSNPMSCLGVKDALVSFWMAKGPKGQIPMTEPQAQAAAESVMRSINLCYEDSDHQTPCTGPKHKKVNKNIEEARENELVSYDEKEKRGFLRFGFSIIGDAPKGSAIGSFVD